MFQAKCFRRDLLLEFLIEGRRHRLGVISQELIDHVWLGDELLEGGPRIRLFLVCPSIVSLQRLHVKHERDQVRDQLH